MGVFNEQIRENLLRLAGHETAKLLTEVEAKTILTQFLNRNYQAIGILRSYCQILESGIFAVNPSQIDELEIELSKVSAGRLTTRNGALCQIGNMWVVFLHKGANEQEAKDSDSVRGFWLYFFDKHTENRFDIIDLDDGNSRTAFGQMSKEAQNAFVSNFVPNCCRKLQIRYAPREVPKGFTAVIHNNRQGAYEIDMLTRSRFLVDEP